MKERDMKWFDEEDEEVSKQCKVLYCELEDLGIINRNEYGDMFFTEHFVDKLDPDIPLSKLQPTDIVEILIHHYHVMDKEAILEYAVLINLMLGVIQQKTGLD